MSTSTADIEHHLVAVRTLAEVLAAGGAWCDPETRCPTEPTADLADAILEALTRTVPELLDADNPIAAVAAVLVVARAAIEGAAALAPFRPKLTPHEVAVEVLDNLELGYIGGLWSDRPAIT